MLNIRLRLPNASGELTCQINAEILWAHFLQDVEAKSGIEYSRLRLLTGHPPKPICAEYGVPVGTVLNDRDTIIVADGKGTVIRGVSSGRYIPPANERWHFTRRICPSDNSCLFHAAAYVLRDKSRTDGPKLREECASVLEQNAGMFTGKGLLDKPVHEYIKWIRSPSSWGGAVELHILSFLTGIEIVALDLKSCHMECFGEGSGYTVRCFLAYTGQHFDAMAMNATYNSPNESEDQVLFNVRDANVVKRAKQFVEAESARK
ncbi:putative OTU like cysteine protease [Trypanosoma vivax]|uniref:Ubiquitin thioesterase OTU n=1 Tax=Trypanosoma vivax (strain Y486) TaxID=1055687 RepID=G0U7F7_TRYVY|nr:hypothetical protein TRVL_03458 [Trypanosoma vivax]KAH8620427.1 putative OTU like cysteine protease [Trypanosoma vivax]CCC51815.1 conserved hypothetical protein [Trypanosoma vivax Y486]